jgi:hypothetical protein
MNPMSTPSKKSVGVLDVVQPCRENFVAKHTITRGFVVAEQLADIEKVLLAAMWIVHESDYLE